MKGIDNLSIRAIRYTGVGTITPPKNDKSLEVIGIDTEADRKGRCFMMCTSLGDVFKPDEFPAFLFSRKYRGKTFVTYNIKYDEGAFLQHLPREQLTELWKTGTTSYHGISYRSIPRKMLQIGYARHYAKFYDIAQFYAMSLEDASQEYLGEGKLEQDTTQYFRYYIKAHWNGIAQYCIRDAELTKRLADYFIRTCESLGVFPRRLYSTAYISFQYFKSTCNIPTVYTLYRYFPQLLQYAMDSYNGGKFEVTQKGPGYFYEYDIVSAYPSEIANLVDIRNCRVRHSKKYIPDAVYGFMDCTVKIPRQIHSPIVVKKKGVATYPFGVIRKVITKNEYDYMVEQGCDVQIHDGWYLTTNKMVYPFKHEIERLTRLKGEFKVDDDLMKYMLIKILMNSLYGKFVQLIKRGNHLYAGINWNIVYGTVITANCRLRITRMQQQHKSVVAVHTDSIISNKPLPYPETKTLGAMGYECEGEGIIVGSGIYQIGDKTRLRGFDTKIDLRELLDVNRNTAKMKKQRPYSWREVIFHNWDLDKINRFVTAPKTIRIDFDTKRLWIDDYKTCREALERTVYSLPLPYNAKFGFF